jgi:hypothetical protein
MKPFEDLKEAIKFVDTYSGSAVDLKLPISDKLNDPMGMNIAIITDRILAKGFRPDGFIQKEGHRIYKYKNL